jgi:hypothetical protein
MPSLTSSSARIPAEGIVRRRGEERRLERGTAFRGVIGIADASLIIEGAERVVRSRPELLERIGKLLKRRLRDCRRTSCDRKSDDEGEQREGVTPGAADYVRLVHRRGLLGSSSLVHAEPLRPSNTNSECDGP